MTRPTGWISLGIVVLLVAVLVVGLKPYLSAILSALVFGPLFRPAYLRILGRVKKPMLAAAATLALVLALVILPLVGLVTLAFNEARAIAEQYRGLSPGALDHVIQRLPLPLHTMQPTIGRHQHPHRHPRRNRVRGVSLGYQHGRIMHLICIERKPVYDKPEKVFPHLGL